MTNLRKKKILIIGALGFDFHCFNTVFRDNEEYEVCAFTIAGEQNVGTLEEQKRFSNWNYIGKTKTYRNIELVYVFGYINFIHGVTCNGFQ